MSDETTQTEAAVQTEAEKKPEGTKPEFILLKSGVLVAGGELVGEKLQALLAEMIVLDDKVGLCEVVFRNDGFPQDSEEQVYGAAYADTHSIAINLQKCWNSACENSEKGDVNLSFMGILWTNVLNAIGHEMDHIDIATRDRELYEVMRSTDDGNEELEDTAQDESVKLIVALAKKFDIEIPTPAEMGWFGVKWMELHTDETTKDLDWVVKARTQVEEGIIYQDDEADAKLSTYREFVKMAHAEGDEDDAWEQATTAAILTAHMDNGVVEEFKAEPVEEPVAETVALDAEAEAVEVTEEALAATATFMGAAAVGAPEAAPVVEAPAVEVPAVPLPAPVAAVAEQHAAAATTATPAPPYTETPYTPNNLDGAIMAKVMEGVWRTLYHHLFTKCGWQQNPQTGRFFFANAAAVLEGVNIQKIITDHGAENFIMEYDTVNAEGQYAAEAFQGMIRGRTTSKQGLPSYTLYLNIGGQRFKRTFLPQNPEKQNAQNAYTKSAVDAQQGNMIAWVFKDEVADAAPFTEKCAVKIHNNNYEVF